MLEGFCCGLINIRGIGAVAGKNSTGIHVGFENVYEVPAEQPRDIHYHKITGLFRVALQPASAVIKVDGRSGVDNRD